MRLRASCFLSVLLLSSSLGCLIVPYKPKSDLPRQEVVDALVPGTETRETLRAKLGSPNVLALHQAYQWEWQGDRTDYWIGVVAPVPGGSGTTGTLKGSPKVFRVLAQFKEDRAVQIDRDIVPILVLPHDPDHTWLAWTGEAKRRRGRLLPPSEIITSDGADRLDAALVGGRGAVFAVDSGGTLWSRSAGQAGLLVRVLDEGTPALMPGSATPCLAIDPSGRFVAVGFQGRLRVWDGVGKQAVLDLTKPVIGAELKGFADIHGLAFSADGRWLAVVAAQASTLVDTASWTPARWLASEGEAAQVAFSPDGRRLIIRGGSLQILETDTGRLLAQHPDAPLGVFVVQGSRLAAPSQSELRIVDLETGQEVGRLGSPPSTFASTPSCGFSGGGSFSIYRRESLERWSLPALERTFREGIRTAPLDGEAAAHGLLDLRMVPISPADMFSYYSITERLLSPDGHWLVDHWHPYLQILSTATLQPLGSIHISEKADDIRIGFSEEGLFFVVAPKEIRLWDLASIAAASGPARIRKE